MNWVTIGSGNGLSPARCQAFIWTNADLLLIGPLGTKFSEIRIKTRNFWFTKIHLKMLSGKWRPFCLGLNVLPWYIYRIWNELPHICHSPVSLLASDGLVQYSTRASAQIILTNAIVMTLSGAYVLLWMKLLCHIGLHRYWAHRYGRFVDRSYCHKNYYLRDCMYASFILLFTVFPGDAYMREWTKPLTGSMTGVTIIHHNNV